MLGASNLGMAFYHGLSPEQLRDYSHLAEELGYESLWVSERYFAEEAFSLLGALATCTSKVRLGFGVANPYTRSIGLLAMAAATCSLLSHGRFILGLGSGGEEVIEAQLGLKRFRPLRALRECLDVLRPLLRGERVSYQGQFIRVQGVRLGAELSRAPPVPIYLAASGERALRLAAREADGVILNAYSPIGFVKYAAELLQELVRREREDTEGRRTGDFRVAGIVVVRLLKEGDGKREELELLEACRKRLANFLLSPSGRSILMRSSLEEGLVKRLLECESEADAHRLLGYDVVREFYLLGYADECRRRLRLYRKAGLQLPILLPRLEDFKVVAEALAEA